MNGGRTGDAISVDMTYVIIVVTRSRFEATPRLWA